MSTMLEYTITKEHIDRAVENQRQPGPHSSKCILAVVLGPGADVGYSLAKVNGVMYKLPKSITKCVNDFDSFSHGRLAEDIFRDRWTGVSFSITEA